MRKLDLATTAVRVWLVRHPMIVCIFIIALCACVMPGLVMFIVVFSACYYAVCKLMVLMMLKGVR